MVTVVMESESGYQTVNVMPENKVDAFIDGFPSGFMLVSVTDDTDHGDAGELFGSSCL